MIIDDSDDDDDHSDGDGDGDEDGNGDDDDDDGGNTVDSGNEHAARDVVEGRVGENKYFSFW